jgi:hypothetical protein
MGLAAAGAPAGRGDGHDLFSQFFVQGIAFTKYIVHNRRVAS